MAIIFTLGQEEIKIQVKVTDCVTDTPFDVSDIIDQKIIFYRLGIRQDKQADLVEDTENPGEFFVQFQGDMPSFLDVRGSWEYAAEIKLDNNAIVQTSQRVVFWVT